MQKREPDFARRVNISLRARVTLIVVMTPEEERVVSQVREVCEKWDPVRQCIAWDSVEGFSAVSGNKNVLTQSRDPLAALDDIIKTDENAVIILKDFHEYWHNPQVKRKIRNFSQKFKYNRRTILIITPVQTVPAEIRDDAVIIHYPPPGAAELSADLDLLLSTSGIASSLSKPGREKLIQAALGMTLNQARRSFSKAIVTHGTIDDSDIDAIIADKKDILSQISFFSAYAVPGGGVYVGPIPGNTAAKTLTDQNDTATPLFDAITSAKIEVDNVTIRDVSKAVSDTLLIDDNCNESALPPDRLDVVFDKSDRPDDGLVLQAGGNTVKDFTVTLNVVAGAAGASKMVTILRQSFGPLAGGQ